MTICDIVPRQNPGPLYQLAFPKPLRSFEHPFLTLATHSSPPASSKPLPSSLRLFVTSSSWPGTFKPLLPWSLPVPGLRQMAYRQP